MFKNLPKKVHFAMIIRRLPLKGTCKKVHLIWFDGVVYFERSDPFVCVLYNKICSMQNQKIISSLSDITIKKFCIQGSENIWIWGSKTNIHRVNFLTSNVYLYVKVQPSDIAIQLKLNSHTGDYQNAQNILIP